MLSSFLTVVVDMKIQIFNSQGSGVEAGVLTGVLKSSKGKVEY